MNYFYSQKLNQMKPSQLKEWFRYKDRSVKLDLAGHAPAAECFFKKEMKEISGKVLEDGEAFAKGTATMGVPTLRKAIARYVKLEMAAGTEADTVMVTSNLYDTLDLLCKTLTNPSDTVLCDSLVAPEILQVLAANELNLMTLEMDNDGMNPDHLEALLAANTGIRFLYAAPDFQEPTGNCITEERRERIAAICAKYGVLVVEDASASQMRLYGDDMLPIKAFDQEGAVVYLGSFEKIFGAGAAVTYLVANRSLLKRVARFAERTGKTAPLWNQLVCEKFMETYSLYEKAEEVCEVYRERYQNAVTVLEEKLPRDIYFTQPDGGFSFWCTDISERLDAELLANNMYVKYGISIAPGSIFAAGEDGAAHSFRLSFAGTAPENFTYGITKIAEEIASLLA